MLPHQHHPRGRSTATHVAAFGAAVLVGFTGLTAATAAQATPAAASTTSRTATPIQRASSAPRVLFAEGFENGTGETPVLLEAYTGAAGQKYTAHPDWLDAANCNGIVTSFDSSNYGGCSNGASQIRALANVLGQVGGAADNGSNHSVSAYSVDSLSAGNLVEFETKTPVTLPAVGRFITFSVDSAALACNLLHPRLNFSVVDGSREIPVSSAPIDPCSDPQAKDYTVPGFANTYRAGSYTSNGAILTSAPEIGIRMRNLEGGGNGNDHAFDNIRVLDATPKLDNAFGAGRHFAGDSVPLTFTVTNTTENGAKPGWSFLENLPAGLRVAAVPKVATTCDAASVAAAGGSGTVQVTGGLTTGSTTCTVTLDVTSATGGTYAIDGSTVSPVTGLDLPEKTTVTFETVTPSVSLTETATPADVNGDGLIGLADSIDYQTVATNTGNVPLVDLTVAGDVSGTHACEASTLAIGASMTCHSAEPHIVTRADVASGAVVDSTVARATGRGQAVISGPAHVNTSLTAALATVDAHETATPMDAQGKPVTQVAAGGSIVYQTAVTNTGNVALHDLVLEGSRSGDGACTVTALAPRESTTCTSAPSTVTQADVDQGRIDDDVTATSIDPDGAVVSGRDSVTTPTIAPVDSLVVSEIGSGETQSGDPVERPSVGDAVRWKAVVTNDGNVTLSDVAVVSKAIGDMTCVPTKLAPGASATCTGPAEKVVQADVDRGDVSDAVDATATNPTGGDVGGEASASILTAAATPKLSAIESAAATSGGDPVAAPAAGDTIAYSVVLSNDGNVTLSSLKGTGNQGGALSCPVASVAPNASVTCAAGVHTVTQGDVDTGLVDDRVEAQGVDPTGGTVPASSSVSTPTVAEAATLAIIESASIGDVTPAADAEVGDVVSFTAVVTNTGNVTVHAVEAISDEHGDFTCPVGDLAPGESITCEATFTVTVTQDDVDSGESLADEVVANGVTSRQTPVESDPSSVLVPMTAADPAISLRQTVTFGQDRHDVLQPGDSIRFRYEISNDGNLVVHTPVVMAGVFGDITCVIDELAPGEKGFCAEPRDYTVTDTDGRAGIITNDAVAHGLVSREAGSVEPTASVLRADPKLVVGNGFWITSNEVKFSIKAEIPMRPIVPMPPLPEKVLAYTGAEGLPWLIGFTVALMLGGAVLFVVRRRRADVRAESATDTPIDGSVND